MSIKVVPAPADQAKQPVRSEKLAKQSEEQKAAQDKDERLVDDDSEEEVSVAEIEEAQEQESSLAGDFTFDGALAEAAASSGSLITEAEEADVSFGNSGDGGSGGTILLVGAVLLVGLGIAALASGGDDDPDDDVPLNADPVLTVDMATLTVDENSVGDSVSVTAEDADGDTVTIGATDAANGTVTDNADGTFTYVPDADFFGSDSFDITGDDGNGGTATQTIDVTVTSTNQDPVVGAGATMSITTEANTPDTFTIDVSDPDGDAVTVTSSDPANGEVTPTGDALVFDYTPDADFTGEDDFVITLDDGAGGVVTYTIDVDVIPAGTGPTEQSIDVGTTQSVVQVDAAGDDFLFTDDRSAITNVNLMNFGADDVIQVTGAASSDYSFGTSGDDLEITFNDGTDFTSIIIDLEDGLAINGLVFDFDTAVTALGFDFMTFGA